MTTSNDILLKAGMTTEQIAAGRLYNIADRMQRDIQLAALLVTEGAKAWQRLYPDTPPEKLAEWAQATLAAASEQLNGGKGTAVPAYPEPYDVLIPNQQAYIDSLKAGGKKKREQQVLDNLKEEARLMVEEGQ